jgi:hypothetical protein
VAKPAHVGGGGRGADIDGLAYPLHRPTVASCQLRVQGLVVRRRLVLSFVLGSGSYREMWSFSGVDSIWRVACFDTCIITNGKLFL